MAQQIEIPADEFFEALAKHLTPAFKEVSYFLPGAGQVSQNIPLPPLTIDQLKEIWTETAEAVAEAKQELQEIQTSYEVGGVGDNEQRGVLNELAGTMDDISTRLGPGAIVDAAGLNLSADEAHHLTMTFLENQMAGAGQAEGAVIGKAQGRLRLIKATLGAVCKLFRLDGVLER